jgi:hypothetical protein
MKHLLTFLFAALCCAFASLAQASTATATIGQKVYFTVTADGTAPFTYQWYKGGTAISGATSGAYTLAAATLTDAGAYTVTVANAAGTTTSDTATLTVAILPPSNARTSINVATVTAAFPPLWSIQQLGLVNPQPLTVSMK